MPSRSTAALILVLTALAGLLGWNYVVKPFNQAGTPVQAEPSPTPLSSLEQQLNALTPEEKVSLLIAVPLTVSDSASDSANRQWATTHRPGVITLFGSSISTSSAERTIAQLEQAYDPTIKPLIAVDHEGGTVQRLNGSGFTKLPSWQSLCSLPASTSATLLAASAEELGQTGVDIVLAPTIDVASSHAILRNRICSSDPQKVADQAQGYIEAFAAQKILPVLKHFPGIGKTSRDLHTTFDRVTITPEDASLYKVLLDQFPRIGVMTSHAGVTNQYPDLPCSLSLDCIKELVLNYPQVVVVSDALDMKAAGFIPNSTEQRSLPEVAVRAATAGNSILLFGPSVSSDDLDQVVGALVTAYNQDELVKNQVDRSALLLLTLRQQMGKL